MPNSGPARPRKSRFSTRFIDWLGVAALAALTVALTELLFIAARVPAAISDLSGFGLTFLHLAALFWIYSVMLATGLAFVGRAVVRRRVPRLAPAVGALCYAAVTLALLLIVHALFTKKRWEFPAKVAALEWFTVLGVLWALLLLWGPVARRAARVARGLPRGFVRRVPVAVLALAAVGAVAVGHLIVHAVYLDVLRVPVGIAALFTAMLAIGATVERQPRRTSAGAALVVGAFALAVFVPGPLGARAKMLVYDHGAASAGMAEALRDLVDFDRDGSASRWLGGPDCAEFDAARGPLVLEIPGDGIDQDCRGSDARRRPALGPPALPPDCTVLPGRQNILLVTVDALRFDAVRPDVMPSLIELARHSETFLRAYSPTAMTVTSVSALFAGRSVSDLGASNPLKDDRLVARSVWTEHLKAAGYRTAVFNLFEIPDLARRGFSRHNGPWIDDSPEGAKSDLTSGALTVSALEFMLERSETPFFVWLHYGDVHAPYVIDHDPKGRVSERSERAAYESGARYVDKYLEGLLAGLQHGGLFQSTIIAVSADHGEELMQRGREGHGANVFEESIRVPLVLWAPGCRPRVVEDPVSLIGLGATLSALVGVPFDGLGLFGPRPVPVVAEGVIGYETFFKRAVIGPRYKLVVDVNNGGAMLFDLATDPGEIDDISAANPQALELMQREYQRWLDSPGAR